MHLQHSKEQQLAGSPPSTLHSLFLSTLPKVRRERLLLANSLPRSPTTASSIPHARPELSSESGVEISEGRRRLRWDVQCVLKQQSVTSSPDWTAGKWGLPIGDPHGASAVVVSPTFPHSVTALCVAFPQLQRMTYMTRKLWPLPSGEWWLQHRFDEALGPPLPSLRRL